MRHETLEDAHMFHQLLGESVQASMIDGRCKGGNQQSLVQFVRKGCEHILHPGVYAKVLGVNTSLTSLKVLLSLHFELQHMQH